MHEKLRNAGVAARLVREPGGTPVGERIRGVVLDPGLDMAAETELLLILAARAEFVRKVVEPALERDEVVVADRYELSTLAYQGMGRGIDLERIRRLNAFATGGLRPDATVLLEVAPGRGLERKRGDPDRMEREAAAFHARVSAAYARLAGSRKDVVRVASDAPLEEVEREVLRALATRWPETFGILTG